MFFCYTWEGAILCVLKMKAKQGVTCKPTGSAPLGTVPTCHLFACGLLTPPLPPGRFLEPLPTWKRIQNLVFSPSFYKSGKAPLGFLGCTEKRDSYLVLFLQEAANGIGSDQRSPCSNRTWCRRDEKRRRGMASALVCVESRHLARSLALPAEQRAISKLVLPGVTPGRAALPHFSPFSFKPQLIWSLSCNS